MAAYLAVFDPRYAQYESAVVSYLMENSHRVCCPLDELAAVSAAGVSTCLVAGAGASALELSACKRFVSCNLSDQISKTSVVQADRPLGTHVSYAYFEVLVLDGGDQGQIGIGLAPAGYPSDSQPGWLQGSYGYHGDDGNKFWAGQEGEDDNGDGQSDEASLRTQYDAFGPTFTTFDIIGCGYDNLQNSVFFTKNGKLLGTAFTDVPPALVPTIGLASSREKLYVNFGQQPFLFDFNFENTAEFTPAPKADPDSASVAPRTRDHHIFQQALAAAVAPLSFMDVPMYAAMKHTSEILSAKERHSSVIGSLKK